MSTLSAVGTNICISPGGSTINYALPWSTLTDGTTTIRKYIADGYLYVDKTLTPTGFAGTENSDWVNVRSVQLRNAADYGFLPTASASDNVIALNNALSYGGNLYVSNAGTYEIDDTIWIPSDTTLTFVTGCTIKKATGSAFSFIFANDGIPTYSRNSNIKLIGNGLTILVNNITDTSSIYRMRGHINFFRVDNLEISGINNTDNPALGQYFGHFGDLDDFNISDFNLNGGKDGLHFHKCNDGIIDNITTDTADDAIAFMVADYDTVTAVVGSITNITVSNCTNTSILNTGGAFCRTSVGSWAAWQSGNTYYKSDLCVNAGRIYIKRDAGGDVAANAPVHTVGRVIGADGIDWDWVQDGVITEGIIDNITFQNCSNIGSDPFFNLSNDIDLVNQVAEYPGTEGNSYIDNLVFDNIDWQPDSDVKMIYAACCVHKVSIINSTIDVSAATLTAMGLITSYNTAHDIVLTEAIIDNCDLKLPDGCNVIYKATTSVGGDISVINSDVTMNYQSLFTILGTEHIDIDLSNSTFKTIGEITGTDITITSVSTVFLDSNDISYPIILTDNNTKAWYDYLFGITKDGSDHVSAWNSKKQIANSNLAATGTPHWSNTGVLFDGVGDYFKSGAFTITTPAWIWVVFKQITNAYGDRIFDGIDNNSGGVYQNNDGNGLVATAASALSSNTDLALNTWGIMRVKFNGAASLLQINNGSATTGDTGSSNMGGFKLATNGAESVFANIEVKEVILRMKDDSAGDATSIYNYLKTRYSL